MQRTFLMPALALLLVARRAPASDPCAGPEIGIEAAVTKRWPTAIDAVRKHIAALEGLDRCARVDLVSAGREIVVVITLRDGRIATRSAVDVEDVEEILDALLVLPDIHPPEVAPPVEGAEEPPLAATSNLAPPPLPMDTSQKNSVPTGFDIGIGAGGRMSGGPVYGGASVTAHANLFRGRWRLGVTGRADLVNVPVHNIDRGEVVFDSSALGLVAGPRLQAWKFDIDLAVGASLVAQEQKARDVRRHEHDVSPRLLTMLRVARGSAAIRPHIAIDGELGNPFSSDALSAPFVGWPFWSVGLGVGLSWSPQ
jgi:nitrate reductase NapAB chaperone NapD